MNKSSIVLAGLSICIGTQAATPNQHLGATANQSLSSGYSYCEQKLPDFDTCIPVGNSSDADIHVSLDGFPPNVQQLQPSYAYSAYNYSQQVHSTTAIVTNAQDDTIYSGSANNFEGLECDQTHCWAWN
jgi:hypothetical protein